MRNQAQRGTWSSERVSNLPEFAAAQRQNPETSRWFKQKWVKTVNEWITLQNQVPENLCFGSRDTRPLCRTSGQPERWGCNGRRKYVMPFVSLIVLWHQYLILSLRIFPIVSAEPRKLLIAGKGHIYASIRARAEWCSGLIQLALSANSRRHSVLITRPHPSSPVLQDRQPALSLPCSAGEHRQLSTSSCVSLGESLSFCVLVSLIC